MAARRPTTRPAGRRAGTMPHGRPTRDPRRPLRHHRIPTRARAPPARRMRHLRGPRTASPGSRGTTPGTTGRDAPVLARVHGLSEARGTGPGPGRTVGPRIRPRHHASSSSGANLTYRPSRTCGMRSLRACASTHEPGTPSISPAASASTSAAEPSPPLTTGAPAYRPALHHAEATRRRRA
jgi:hypothetical protein